VVHSLDQVHKDCILAQSLHLLAPDWWSRPVRRRLRLRSGIHSHEAVAQHIVEVR